MPFLLLSKMMFDWGWWVIKGLFSPSTWATAFGREHASTWLVACAVGAVGLGVLWFEPFKRGDRPGLMTVRECGGNLAQMRSETLEKAAAKQREIEVVAEAERRVRDEHAREAATRTAELEARLQEAEKLGQLGLDADVIRNWNRKVRR
jgi:hypothetical protein